jgi:hypothetical protein
MQSEGKWRNYKETMRENTAQEKHDNSGERREKERKRKKQRKNKGIIWGWRGEGK